MLRTGVTGVGEACREWLLILGRCDEQANIVEIFAWDVDPEVSEEGGGREASVN